MMKILHSYWAYVVLLVLIIAVVNAIIGFTSKKEFKLEKDFRISLFALIVTHIQLLIGLGWYFMSPWYKSAKASGMAETMKNADVRLLAVEHPIMMIVAIIFVTIGWSRHKKQATDVGKFKSIAIFYGIGLLLMLSRIPWNQWFA